MPKGIVHRNGYVPRRLDIYKDKKGHWVWWGDEAIAVKQTPGTMHWVLLEKPKLRSRIQRRER